MATKEFVTQELKARGMNRDATDTDVFNYNKYGAGIFDKTFGGKSGVPTEEGDAMTSGQAGQAASTASTANSLPTLNTLKQQEQSLIQETEELSDQGQASANLLEKLLKAKQQGAPYEQKIAQTKERIAARTFSDYTKRGLTVDQAIGAMQEDIARANSQITYLDQQKQSMVDSATELNNSFAESMNAMLAGTQWKLTNVQQQAADLQNMAFSQAQLLSGVMPEGLPPEYQAMWKAQSDATIAANAPRGGGGGGITDADIASIDAYANSIRSGQGSLSQVPSDLRPYVLQRMNESDQLAYQQEYYQVPGGEGVFGDIARKVSGGASDYLGSMDPNAPSFQEYQSNIYNEPDPWAAFFGGATSGTTPTINDEL